MKEKNTYQQAAEEFSDCLLAKKIDYETLERRSKFCVRIRFTGLYNGMPVIWDATIQTIQDKFRDILKQELIDLEGRALKQSLTIIENEQSYGIEVLLNLTEIDQAAIERTMIMIRKYKRLHIGRHEYGEAVLYVPG